MHAFVYLNDENKVFELENQIEEIISKVLTLLAQVNVLPEESIDSIKEEILNKEMDKNNRIYKVL